MSGREPKSLLAPRQAPMTALGRFVDSLIQTFEDRRPGLPDATAAAGEAATARFFSEIYGPEKTRLREVIRTQEPHLSDEAHEAFFREIDGLIEKTMIPAYTRLATRFTPRERNDFYLTAEKLHGVERGAWALGGILVGTFVIWAPFIPLTAKEWILPFMLAGLFFPNIRRYWAFRRYETELNHLVARADREISRIDVAYLSAGDVIPELRELEQAEADRQRLAASRQKEG